MIKFLRQLFCKHEFEKEKIKGGFFVVDGWFFVPFQYRCKKCGKVVKGNWQ
jgi:hypothetical protein